ncbi:MAG: flagellar hook-basal body complex protein FliE [Methylocystis sp.]|jgi:flagellar hook-basal body complex protein FliE|nr:flagellar hook-basal body complex protein FliE [Methylocystis sp.]MCA3583418.1 flagellar hook-basal body complex protein FliE [Methylocystis sp.]MCA3589119.1 flagellar hook-basal body complex protein FliE [Methylocystis sp.]MCA3591937.1 flagellar hook-basal body complex protein FliE [Methylocystis sp.]
MASPISAANAYSSIQRLGTGAAMPVSRPDAISGADSGGFASLVQKFVGGTAETAQKAEGQMMQATAGKGDLVDVVTAVTESEAALETLVAVRDRVIAAYEEIMRMPI